MDDFIAFTKVSLPYGWLGNMAPYPVREGDLVWRTTEALFQASRFTDEAIRRTIHSQASPMAAKMVAKRHRSAMTGTPQSSEDIASMRRILELKLSCHPKLQSLLLATGDRLIIEDCTRRPRGSGLFWGAALQAGGWTGENQLGLLWMGLREELHRKQERT